MYTNEKSNHNNLKGDIDCLLISMWDKNATWEAQRDEKEIVKRGRYVLDFYYQDYI